MSILIKGMEMPQNGCTTIIIMSNGTVYRTGDLKELGTAVPVRDHGDLIDRDMVLRKAWDVETFVDAVKYAPSIIPAEEGE